MQPFEILFSNQHRALGVCPSRMDELPQAIEMLGITPHRPVLVLVGGAGGVESRHMPIILRISQIIVEIAGKFQGIIISGGTDAGAMAAVGQAHAQKESHCPLIGIAPENLVSWPNGPQEKGFLFWKKRRGPLESHYTHFILTPGNQWGDESLWIDRAATDLADSLPSVTLAVNGGKIVEQDVAFSIKYGRPVVVISGTGRWADKVAAEPPSTDLLTVIPADDEAIIYDTIGTMLDQEHN